MRGQQRSLGTPRYQISYHDLPQFEDHVEFQPQRTALTQVSDLPESKYFYIQGETNSGGTAMLPDIGMDPTSEQDITGREELHMDHDHT